MLSCHKTKEPIDLEKKKVKLRTLEVKLALKAEFHHEDLLYTLKMLSFVLLHEALTGVRGAKSKLCHIGKYNRISLKKDSYIFYVRNNKKINRKKCNKENCFS